MKRKTHGPGGKKLYPLSKGEVPCLIWNLGVVVLKTELLERSEHRSTSDVDVGGAEFSGCDVLR